MILLTDVHRTSCSVLATKKMQSEPKSASTSEVATPFWMRPREAGTPEFCTRIAQVVQSLAVGRNALTTRLQKLGKESNGATHEWKKIQRVTDVAKMVEAREQEVLAGLETLSGGADA